jgi:hypothetical protein
MDHAMPKHTPFLYGRRTCIFCTGHPPDVKITNEHVFADWLRELFPRDGSTTHTHGVIVWPTSAGAPQVDPSVWLNPRGHGHSGSKRVRAVCRTCNSEWLSNRVEEVAKPILIPMIAGRSCALNLDMQHRLATWAVKTVMTAEHVNKGKSVIQQSGRTWLKDKLTPPAGWFVWAAPYSGANWRDLGIFQHSGKLEIPDIPSDTLAHHNLGLTFMGLGRLFFLVRHSTWPSLWDALASPIAHVHRLWPPSSDVIDWPPPYVFSDREAEYFTTYLARVLCQPVKVEQ